MRSDREVVVASEWTKYDFGRFRNLLSAREKPTDKTTDSEAVLKKLLQFVREWLKGMVA